MPRASAEERAASFYRARPRRPEPPAGIGADARRLWREIVGCKPPDWFDAGSLPVLGLYVDAVVAAERIRRGLRKLGAGTPAYSRATIDWARVCSVAFRASRQLRLSVQQTIEPHDDSARVGERMPIPAPAMAERDARLIGGRAFQ